MLEYLVLYESDTGNTKKIASEIFSELPGMCKDLLNIHDCDEIPEALTYFIGFCIHRNTCSLDIGNFLGTLSGKRVALFGTCGAGNSIDYFKHIENSALIWLEDDNEYLGGFFCQGKMPQPVRQKYESMLQHESGEDAARIQEQLKNFDEAMIHPNTEDCKNARLFTQKCLSELS